ncbi:MAG: hypothetical protein ACKVTZ_09010 [Bacteroidia bacterium]
MKTLLKIGGFIILTLILSALAYYLYLTDFGRINLFSVEPRKPKLEKPVTYNIGWWANQKALIVDRLQVDIIESKLNLLNSESLISYTIGGRLNYQKSWQPVIEEVHISERINLDTTLNCDRIIEITPVIQDKENQNASDGFTKFEFKNEHTITSNHWGINRIKFICGQKEQTIELRQRK